MTFWSMKVKLNKYRNVMETMRKYSTMVTTALCLLYSHIKQTKYLELFQNKWN